DAERVARTDLERAVAACRERYDVVLVDTGPVLGSIEASFAIAAADDVLLVLPRGERQPRVADALTRLEGIGAQSPGVVFNRATGADVAASRYGSRASTARAA